MGRQVQVNFTAEEVIVGINETENVVAVCTGYAVNGVVDPDRGYQWAMIRGTDLQELLSASPPWAPSKPAGTYRNEDLWQFIDRFREKDLLERMGLPPLNTTPPQIEMNQGSTT